jgi:multiple sugar transport system permease protein
MNRSVKAWRTMFGWSLNIGLGAAAVLMLAPLVWMFSTSVRPVGESVTVPPKWLPTTWDLSNYGRLASDEYPILLFFQNSLFVSVLCTIGIVLTSCLAGFAFAKVSFRFRDQLFALLLVALMIPIQVTVVPLYLIIQQLGLMNSLWALVIPALLGAFAPGIPGAFGIFMMRQFFKNTPDALIEAATLDGASRLQIFWRIALPLARPAIASLGLIVFILSWNDYFSPLVFLNTTDTMTLAVGIQSLRPPFGQGSSLVMAAVTMAVVPVLAIFLLGQRWIVQGFVSSGLKD